MSETNSGPVSQWVGLNRDLKAYQLAMMGLIGICIVLSIGLVIALFQDQIVVLEQEQGQRSYFTGSRKSTAPRNEDVEAFVKDFVRQRYNFKSNRLDLMGKNLSPIVTDSYLKACMEMLQRDLLTGQSDEIAQNVGEIQATVSDKAVQATFDKIVRFKGVPMVVPTQISLQIISGASNRWNPLGLYINGVVEHEGR